MHIPLVIEQIMVQDDQIACLSRNFEVIPKNPPAPPVKINPPVISDVLNWMQILLPDKPYWSPIHISHNLHQAGINPQMAHAASTRLIWNCRSNISTGSWVKLT